MFWVRQTTREVVVGLVCVLSSLSETPGRLCRDHAAVQCTEAQRRNSQPLNVVAALVALLTSRAVGERRLHDTGRSCYWLLAGLFPLVGILVLLYICLQPRTEGSR
ncbi:DUF805 domain-containing protein [Rhodobacteraceae bacterium DSL-40]|uniref:DUF805 domain-containing protein n=1 Tax=Amaricoccus sp. B4 TaxID=3368557 RepID=UPI000DACBE04